MLSSIGRNLTHFHKSHLLFTSSRLMSNNADSEYYDVIISGGGLIGGAMTCALGTSSYFEQKKILMLDAASAPVSKEYSSSDPFSNRVCAISPGSKRLMEHLQFWDKIERKCSVKKMQIWDACSESFITFDKDNMTTDLCYIIENNVMISNIQERIKEMNSDHVVTQYNSRIMSCELPRNYALDDANERIPNAKVTLQDGKTLECGLLIAADGVKSFIAEEAKIPKLTWEYGQSAVVATLRLSESIDNFVAWQRFLPTGPIALLPLDDEHSSLVWSTTDEHAKELVTMTNEKFAEEVNNAFWFEYEKHASTQSVERQFKEILKAANPKHETDALQLPSAIAAVVGKKEKFPLGFSHSNYYVKPRLALIGDSAHRIHPLAGQGANLGFGDVVCLLDVLEQAIYRGKDLGCLLHLQDYESKRQRHNFAVAAITDGLSKLYSTTAKPIVLLRSLGLMGTNALKPLKDFITSEAMNS